MPRNLRCALKILLFASVALFLFVTVSLVIVHRVRSVPFSYEHNGTDLTFASSDGGWRGEENMLSGREFSTVLFEFELYRIRSRQPALRLLRTKPWKKPWQWAWLFDRSRSPKWKVPYTPLEALPVPIHPALPLDHVTSVERTEAQRKADAYLATLQ